METHLVLRCGHPLHARQDRLEAIQDAHRLIKKEYEDFWRHCGSKPFDADLPEDPETCMVWWNNRAPVTLRFTVQSIKIIPHGVKGPSKVSK